LDILGLQGEQQMVVGNSGNGFAPSSSSEALTSSLLLRTSCCGSYHVRRGKYSSCCADIAWRQCARCSWFAPAVVHQQATIIHNLARQNPSPALLPTFPQRRASSVRTHQQMPLDAPMTMILRHPLQHLARTTPLISPRLLPSTLVPPVCLRGTRPKTKEPTANHCPAAHEICIMLVARSREGIILPRGSGACPPMASFFQVFLFFLHTL